MNGPVLFFDGVCNLCNAAVQFVIRHDKQGVVRFASLQSDAGKRALAVVSARLGRVPDSLILLDGDDYYTESDAALRVAGYLNGGWKLLASLRVFPGVIRNGVYRVIARYRYKWFGSRAACMLPTPELRSRFLT